MSFLYLTADEISTPTGGGAVTGNESAALAELGPCEVWGRKELEDPAHRMIGAGFWWSEPWRWDRMALGRLRKLAAVPGLCHGYAGTFGRTVLFLKEWGCKVAWTAAAHDVAASRKAHEELGLPFDYPHLTDPDLWEAYLQPYKDADVLVVPSTHSERVMRGFGCENRIVVIPHGCELPEKVPPLPKTFTVGYMGACGSPDKGVRYLLEAWKKLAWKDAVLLLAGRDSTSDWVSELIRRFGGGNVVRLGWVKDVADFYGRISCYVQSSVSEGFGLEILEAMAHGRPVICSDGAGAADLVPAWYRTKAKDVDELVSKIEQVRIRGGCVGVGYPDWREIAVNHTWDKIRARYQETWKGLLA